MSSRFPPPPLYYTQEIPEHPPPIPKGPCTLFGGSLVIQNPDEHVQGGEGDQGSAAGVRAQTGGKEEAEPAWSRSDFLLSLTRSLDAFRQVMVAMEDKATAATKRKRQDSEDVHPLHSEQTVPEAAPEAAPLAALTSSLAHSRALLSSLRSIQSRHYLLALLREQKAQVDAERERLATEIDRLEECLATSATTHS